MATTIHIPGGLLAEVDRRASELKLSRSRYIVRVLEEALRARSDWSERLEARRAVDEMMAAIRARRSSKRPPRLSG
jgi:metal-responsive CopG/Arc/MetJ family transcriptional regulator